jgi:restriction system protein
MKCYYRVMLGKKSVHADECLAGGFIGSGFGSIERDIRNELTDDVRAFNQHFMPELQGMWPEKSKIALGLWCGFAWTICRGIRAGDIVLCPDGDGSYRLGEVVGDYQYAPGQALPHRRAVRWLDIAIARCAMSEALQNSTGSIGTVSNVSAYAVEIERFMSEVAVPITVIATDPVIEDPLAFAMEKHLEDFLVRNWSQTELSRDFAIYEEDGEPVGQQYSTDAGAIDILAVSHDRKRLLVVELKRGRASDVVVGQTLRYMGYVAEQIAEPGQTVEGAIIALEDDQKLRWALAAVPAMSFYRYQVSFRLLKG